MSQQHTLRQELRRKREELSPETRLAAAGAVLSRVQRLPDFQRAHHIAGYFGNKGELDPMPLLAHAVRMRKRCYLPVLDPRHRGRLRFGRWQLGDSLETNRFGIPEPLDHDGSHITPGRLDLVLVPLVGFDRQCHRLGMGGGFYDRTFAFARHRSQTDRPYLLGIAFEVQRVDRLMTNSWDVGLDAVVTEDALYRPGESI